MTSPVRLESRTDSRNDIAEETGEELFRSYSRHLLAQHGAKTYKIVLSSGLSCPVRCGFCDIRGSSSFHGKSGRGRAIAEQLALRLPRVRERFGAVKFLAYFQSHTNTYAPVDELEEIYRTALEHAEISGLCIGTRPDCLPDDVIALLSRLSSEKPVTLELGVQSLDDSTLELLGRGHGAESSRDAIARLRRQAPSVEIVAHLIFGTPVDPPAIAQRTAEALSRLGVQGVKLHQLMILENSDLARRYRAAPFDLPALEEYAVQVAEFLDHLDPRIFVERLAATATHPEECLAPAWSRGRWGPHNEIRRVLRERGCRQGRFVQSAVTVQ